MLLALKKNYPDHLPQDGKNDDKEIKEGGRKKKRPDFTLGMTGQERRTTLQVLILQAGIRIRHLFHSWFFLKPIFSSRLSGYQSFLRPKGIPEINWFVLFGLRMLWFIGGIWNAYPKIERLFYRLRLIDLFKWFHFKIMNHIMEQMKKSTVDWEKTKNIPVPEYDWKKGSPQEFYETYVKNPHPVILRNFMEGTELLECTYDKMLEKYGEETVALSGLKNASFGKLKDVQNPGVYLQNSEAIFNRHPELWKLLQTDRLEDYSQMKSSFAQFFLGRQGTGAPLHYALAWNFFYMVDGVKKWYFIDPTDWYLAYPRFTSGSGAGYFFGLYPDEYKRDLTPALKYCPFYVAELRPGDVLLNPAYWGHGVRNMSEKSVGIATRWSVDGIQGKNFMYVEEDYEINRWASFNFFSGLLSFIQMHLLLYEPSPQHDEHLTIREVGVSSFYSLQKQACTGKHKDGRKVVPL